MLVLMCPQVSVAIFPHTSVEMHPQVPAAAPRSAPQPRPVLRHVPQAICVQSASQWFVGAYRSFRVTCCMLGSPRQLPAVPAVLQLPQARNRTTAAPPVSPWGHRRCWYKRLESANRVGVSDLATAGPCARLLTSHTRCTKPHGLHNPPLFAAACWATWGGRAGSLRRVRRLHVARRC